MWALAGFWEGSTAMPHEVDLGSFKIGGSHPHFLIAGPCVIESEGLVLETAQRIAEVARALKIPYIFKSSYDKANRSSIGSFRGPGLKAGLAVLRKVREQVGVPVLTDVHTAEDILQAAEAVDVLQIPAFLCRQTDLLVAAAKTGRAVNVKKGQFLSPGEMDNVVKKLEESGTTRIMLTERGSSFGYQNLVVDMRSLPIMQRFGYPVVFDATHSVQLPGGAGTQSSGQREFVAPLACAAAAAGCDGFFMEVHPEPDRALSDGPNMVPLSRLKPLLERLMRICQAAGKGTEVTL
jgi:2-dehydro-3-deoxyphosphooctonate aldolase (KDO 8-P synthase)